MSTKPPSRVVFVGNIPYGLSEEQITDIFSRAGKVLNFRLVYDRETGKPKGFGFAEYPDNGTFSPSRAYRFEFDLWQARPASPPANQPKSTWSDSAASAVRNLNDTEIMGRKLRVDFSNEKPSTNDIDEGPPGAANGSGSNSYQQQEAPALPPLPPGKDLPAGVSATDAISRTLRTLPPAQLLDILQQMKTMSGADPARATELLSQAPQLSYAIFQALLLMDLVSPDAIHSVVDPGATVPPPAPALSYGAPPAASATYQQHPIANNTPPVAMPYAPPTAPPAATPTPVSAAAPQDTDALMQQVLALPQATIDQLPEAERAQIMALRASLMGQAR